MKRYVFEDQIVVICHSSENYVRLRSWPDGRLLEGYHRKDSLGKYPELMDIDPPYKYSESDGEDVRYYMIINHLSKDEVDFLWKYIGSKSQAQG